MKSVGCMRVIYLLSVVEHSWSCVTSLHGTDVAQCTVHTYIHMWIYFYFNPANHAMYVYSVTIYVNCKYVKRAIKYHYHVYTVHYHNMEFTIHDIIHLCLCYRSI